LRIHLAGTSALAVVVACAAAPAPVRAQAACQREVCLDAVETGSALTFVAENGRFFDMRLVLELTQTRNLLPLRPAPQSWILPPRSRLPLLTLHTIDAEAASHYDYRWDVFLGNPQAHHDDSVRYRLPFDARSPRLLLQGIAGTFSHMGSYTYSFDFLMPVGTPVRAARGGVVARVLAGYTRGGPIEGLRDRANLVTVRHVDGTYGEYVHLDAGGSVVREGEPVWTGQLLAYSGNTGFTSEPHLHFMVWKATADGRFASVPIRFDDGTDQGYVPREGLSYGAAYDPGGLLVGSPASISYSAPAGSP
jgi:murein DD-endopeptidase MepM/ murein hydrolase activator NlpD